ncbi:MAG: hypothetical protein AB7I27_17440 [Bacteriovoracaceae bacterium]
MPLLIMLILSSQLFATSINRFSAKNFNLNYLSPIGHGDVEHLSVSGGFGVKKNDPYPIEMEKVNNTYVLRTPVMDIEWSVGQILLDMEKIVSQKISLDIGGNDNFVEGEKFSFKPKDHGDYTFESFKVNCNGQSVQKNITNRMIENCVYAMSAQVNKLDIPADSFIIDIITGLPEKIEEEKNLPAYDLNFKVQEGKFNLYLLARYYLRAGVRVWGNIEFKDDFQRAIIRVDQIKVGYVSMTQFIMNQMRSRIKNPKIKIEPPYIYVELRKRKP